MKVNLLGPFAKTSDDYQLVVFNPFDKSTI